MRIFRHPIHPMLVPIPIACFVGVLLTDLTYWRSADMMWADFSAWLVTVGVIFGFLAAIFGLIDFLGSRLDPRPIAGMAARDRQCRGAHPGHAQHVRSFARRLDFGGAVGPHSFRRDRADSDVHRLDGLIDGLSPSASESRNETRHQIVVARADAPRRR